MNTCSAPTPAPVAPVVRVTTGPMKETTVKVAAKLINVSENTTSSARFPAISLIFGRGPGTGVIRGTLTRIKPIAKAHTAADSQNVARQPNAPPTTDPIGTPATNATVSPPMTIANARPRISSGTRAAAATVASAPMKAMAMPEATRSANSAG